MTAAQDVDVRGAEAREATNLEPDCGLRGGSVLEGDSRVVVEAVGDDGTVVVEAVIAVGDCVTEGLRF